MGDSSNGGKLSVVTRIGYGVGDLYGGGALAIISFYYLFFLTDVVKISPALAGTAFLVSRVWDAVSDPLMGIISDRTRTRWGRRRPYFLIGIFAIFGSFVLLWYVTPFDAEIARFLYALATYVLFSTVFTMVWVPYMAIAAELTSDYNERTRLATYRMVCSNIAGVLGATVSIELARSFTDLRTGYLVMATVFGAFFALPYLMTFLTTREPTDRPAPGPVPTVREFARRNFAEPFRLRPFRQISVIYLATFVAQDAIMALVIYFMTHYLGTPGLMTPLLGVVYGSIIIVIPLAGRFAERFGKRRTYMTAGVLWITAFVYTIFIRPEFPAWTVFIFGFVFGFALGGTQVMVMAMFPDIPDVDELLTGTRREGIFSGLFAFLRKSSSALALFIISVILEAAGYVAPIEQVVDGALVNVEQAQSESFVLVLRIIFVAIPASLILTGLLTARQFPITPEVHARLRAFLPRLRAHREEHGESELPSDLQAERTELTSILTGRATPSVVPR